MYKKAKDRTWLNEHTRRSKIVIVDNTVSDDEWRVFRERDREAEQSFETPVKEGKPDVKTFKRVVDNTHPPTRIKRPPKKKKKKKKNTKKKGNEQLSKRKVKIKVREQMTNSINNKQESYLGMMWQGVSSARKIWVMTFFYGLLTRYEKEEFTRILEKEADALLSPEALKVKNAHRQVEDDILEAERDAKNAKQTVANKAFLDSFTSTRPKRTKKQPIPDKLLPAIDIIPKKCQRDLDEFQMHMSYIEDGIWESRDKSRADEIRDRYPQKGNIAGVYRFTNLVNGKSYIGQTKNVWGRLKDHLSKKGLEKKQEDLQRAIRKYGIDKFEFEMIIDDKQDPLMKKMDERLRVEALYVEKYNSYLNGYNTEPCFIDPKMKKRLFKKGKTWYHYLDYRLL